MANELAAQAEGDGDLAALISLQAEIGIHGFLDDLFGGGFGHFLDIHAALGAGHDDRLAQRAVQQHGAVKFALNFLAGRDEQAVDLLAFLAGLLGDEYIAEHRLRFGGGILHAVGQVHATLEAVLKRAFASAAGVDLTFHHHALMAFAK